MRGTKLDVFGYSQERRAERQLIVDYSATVTQLIDGLQRDNHPLAVEIASVPETIRGYGYIKERNLAEAKACEADLMATWLGDEMPAAAAE